MPVNIFTQSRVVIAYLTATHLYTECIFHHYSIQLRQNMMRKIGIVVKYTDDLQSATVRLSPHHPYFAMFNFTR